MMSHTNTTSEENFDMALPMVEVVDGVVSGQWLDTGLDADAVEFCPRAGYNQWAVIGTYKLRESETGAF